MNHDMSKIKSYALVPVEELTQVEIARKELWQIVESWDLSPLQMMQLQNVCAPFWRIANRKWKTVKANPTAE